MFLCMPGWLSEPFGNLFSIVFSAVWVANVGIPLVATLSAIGAAYFFLRKQISHDTKIVEDERRQAKGRTYASSLKGAVSSLGSIARQIAQGGLTDAEISSWRTSLNLVTGDLGRAWIRLRDGLERDAELFSDVSAYTRSMTPRLNVWMSEAHAAENVHLPIVARARACAYLLEVYAEFFDRTADQLEDWGGNLPLPSSSARLPAMPPEMHLPGGVLTFVWPRQYSLDPPPWFGDKGYEEWADQDRIEFAMVAQAIAERL